MPGKEAETPKIGTKHQRSYFPITTEEAQIFAGLSVSPAVNPSPLSSDEQLAIYLRTDFLTP
ncbi:hypothetical protein Syn8016DRAFT_1414 [Synechococcus sp. WH 8016]|nr:hypothetical protein Syn8016DRAFT_1414 [Synechococcus sp. WH 8016]